MKRRIIVLRGRHTAAILADAERAGLTEARRLTIVSLPGDRLAEPGDITPDAVRASINDDIVVLANGGTTAQLVPVLLAVVARAGRWVVVELQPGCAPVRLGDGEADTCACGCGERPQFAAISCARRSPG